MIASLDTNILVDILNGKRPAVRARYEAEINSGTTIVVSSLAAHELMFGALISRRPDHHAQQARRLLANHEVVDLTAADAYAAARLRSGLSDRGKGIGSFDTLIAGQALNRGWIMVTANTDEFGRVDALTVVDWSRTAA